MALYSEGQGSISGDGYFTIGEIGDKEDDMDGYYGAAQGHYKLNYSRKGNQDDGTICNVTAKQGVCYKICNTFSDGRKIESTERMVPSSRCSH